mmetsp:Transcript_6771/g.11151  ORF Transcript_6771/g.11151 Transcript_6771/m.11151 type:complete len:162 (-) Transcript_6771:1561-2046(-)
MANTQGLIVRDRALQIKWATRNKSLFVNSLAKSANWESEVLPLFAKYGALDMAQCRLISRSGKHVNSGIIVFQSRDDAQSARNNLNGKLFKKQKLFVKWEQSVYVIPQVDADASSEIDARGDKLDISNGPKHQQGYTQYPHFSVHVRFRGSQASTEHYFLE